MWRKRAVFARCFIAFLCECYTALLIKLVKGFPFHFVCYFILMFGCEIWHCKKTPYVIMREETQNFRHKIRFLIIFESWENQEQCLLVLTQSSFWITPSVEVHIKLVKPHFAYYRKIVLPFVLSGILMTLGGLVVFLLITTGSECLFPFLLCWSPLDKDLNPFKFPNVLLYCSRILSFSWYFPLTPFLFASVLILERVIEICHLEIFSCSEGTEICVKNPVLYLSDRKEYLVICHQN